VKIPDEIEQLEQCIFAALAAIETEAG